MTAMNPTKMYHERATSWGAIMGFIVVFVLVVVVETVDDVIV